MGEVVKFPKIARHNGWVMDMPAPKVKIIIEAEWHPTGEVSKEHYKEAGAMQLMEIVALRVQDLLAHGGGTISFKVK